MPWSFKEWYEAHGASLNQKRQRRYVEDSQYRQRVLERNRAARKVARARRLEERREARDATTVSVARRQWRAVEWDVGGGKILKLFTLGMLAQALTKSPRTLYKWEAKGLLPETPYRTEKGDRLYTVTQVEEIRAKLAQLGKLEPGIKARASGRPPRGVRLDVKVNGKKDSWVFFRAGVLAKVLGRTVETLQEWEGRGILPETPFRVSQKRHRLYSPEMIESVKNALDDVGGTMREDTAPQFAARVQTDWKKLGVFGAKLA